MISGLGAFDTLDNAKAQVSRIMTTNKNQYVNGYDAFIVDRDNGQVATRATQPEPKLSWQDAVAAVPAAASSTGAGA